MRNRPDRHKVCTLMQQRNERDPSKWGLCGHVTLASSSSRGHAQGALAQVVREKWTLISCSANGPVPAIIKKKRLDPKKHFYRT